MEVGEVFSREQKGQQPAVSPFLLSAFGVSLCARRGGVGTALRRPPAGFPTQGPARSPHGALRRTDEALAEPGEVAGN